MSVYIHAWRGFGPRWRAVRVRKDVEGREFSSRAVKVYLGR